MRVAIDGSFLALPPSGTGTYLRELTTALGQIAPDLDLRLLDPIWDADLRRADGRVATLVDRLRRDRRVQRAHWDLHGVATAAARLRPNLLHVPHFAAPLRPPCPLIVTIHDVIPLVLPAYRASRAMRTNLQIHQRTIRAARVILTPSAFAANEIAQTLKIGSECIRVTPEAAGSDYRPAATNGLDPAVAARFGIRGRYIFNVGGFDVRKNLPVLLESFAKLRANLSEPLTLVIAGKPHSDNPVVFPPLEPVIRQLGLDGAVVLPGRISDDEKLALYQGAALYATPSLHEGFGLTALEAMACGVPTIAANRTSLPEVVGDGGILAEPTPDAFAAAMLAVLTDASGAETLRTRGVARAATFSWQRTARLTLDAYHEVVAMQTPNKRTERTD